MLRMSLPFSAAIALVAAYLALSASPCVGEPISTEESLTIPAPDPPPQEMSSDAIALFKARDYAGALKLWQEAVKKNPDLPPAQFIMAQLYLSAGMPGEAKAALDRAIVDAPGDPEPYLLQASMALSDRDPAKAESLFKKANGLIPSLTKSAKRKQTLELQVQGGMAAIAAARSDWASVQKSLEAALKIDPKNVAVKQRLTHCLLQQKNIDGALAILRETAKDDPAMPAAEAALVQFYQRANDIENAKKWMKAAISAAPKSVKTRLTVGQCALEMGLMDDAQTNAVAAMKLDAKSLEAEFFRGLVALCQKDYRTAESYFESSLKRASANNKFPISNNLALALIEQDDPAKTRRALEYAEANAKEFPKSANAVSTYGWILYRSGKLDEAEKALHTAAAAGPLSVDTAYYTARLTVDRGHKPEAKKLLETALKTPGRSMFRQDAEDLLEDLKK
jgi:tetratricopeptide (TPR) repeat protein